jgi:catalase
VVIPDGKSAVDALAGDGRVLEFVKDQYRHCKPILLMGAATRLLKKAGIPEQLPSGKSDPGMILGDANDADATSKAFLTALAAHRHFDRETDPPAV